MPRAVSLPATATPLSEVPEIAAKAESMGYESIWIPEVATNDAFALGCAIATKTSKARIGTAVVPVNTRGPAMLAMSAATLGSVSGGRSICGIGASSEAIVSDWNMQPTSLPLTRCAETMTVLKQAFAGEKVTLDGRAVKVKNFRLQPAPQVAPEIHLAALNPKMLQLAGREADGVILNLIHEDFVGTALAEVAKGAAEAGRTLDDIEVVMRAQAYIGPDTDQARDAFANAFAPYVIARGYDSFFTWAGFGESVEGVRAAFANRDRLASRAAISDEMIDAMCFTGTADEVRARVERYEAQGVDTVAVHAFWPTPDQIHTILDACAP